MEKEINRNLNSKIYENLPEELSETAKLFEGRQKDIVLLSGLVALSACIPKVYGIYNGNRIYSNLFLIVIGPPASGKGVMNNARGFVETIHNDVVTQSKLKIKKWKEDMNKENKEPRPRPKFRSKIIPGNISSADLYDKMKYADNGGIIIESEADTLSNMLTQDWGDFSDVLRKAFHHEFVSLSRKTRGLNLEIRKPKLSLLLTGTPGQLKPLVQSKENGLFSRFTYYAFEEINDWKNVFGEKKDIAIHFKRFGSGIIFSMYKTLKSREKPLEFTLTIDQEEKFNKLMWGISEEVKRNYPKRFLSNVRRHGIMYFRICMILSVLRNKDNLSKMTVLSCTDNDFYTASLLIKDLFDHAWFVYEKQGDSKNELSSVDESILKSLNKKFTSSEAVTLAKEYGISSRTMYNRFRKWTDLKLIKKIKQGEFEKI